MKVEIKVLKSGSCGCANCGRHQDGWRLHPYTVWHKADNEKRGHNDPVCSMECAIDYAEALIDYAEALKEVQA